MFAIIFWEYISQSMLYAEARGHTGSWAGARLISSIYWEAFTWAALLSAYFISTYLLSVVGISGLALAVISFGVIVSNPQRRRDYEYFEPPYEEPHFPKWDAQMKREMAESKG